MMNPQILININTDNNIIGNTSFHIKEYTCLKIVYSLLKFDMKITKIIYNLKYNLNELCRGSQF